jgi:uncharacterized protein
LKSKLQSLYLLQIIDTELDELRELRGDLPDTVNQMEEKLRFVEQRIEECDAALKKGTLDRAMKEQVSLELIAKIEKYRGQQLEVHNNKEYDALTREMEVAENTISTYEAEIEAYADQAEQIRASKVQFEQQREVLQKDLEEKREELREILSTTGQEEELLVGLRESALANIDEDEFVQYSRIRGAKNGKAVAPIRRGSCSGCYNIVPPQRILEIKKNDRMFICEHCGRILVSEEIATETKR